MRAPARELDENERTSRHSREERKFVALIELFDTAIVWQRETWFSVYKVKRATLALSETTSFR